MPWPDVTVHGMARCHSPCLGEVLQGVLPLTVLLGRVTEAKVVISPLAYSPLSLLTVREPPRFGLGG